MKGLSYLGLDHTGFGWEVKVRLEILICYLDGDIGFSCVACPPVLLILRRAASSFFTTFLSSFVGPSVIRLFSADGGWLFSVIVVSERKIQMFLSRTTGHERLESEGRGEMQYGLWRLLSQRKKDDKTA